jgi:hypothetical protein
MSDFNTEEINAEETALTSAELNTTIKLPLWKNLIDAIETHPEDWAFGTLHTHDEIGSIMGVSYGTTAYSANLSRANDELTHMGMRLKNIRGTGYEVLEPEKYLDESVHHLSKGARQIRKSYNIASGCKLNYVSPEKRRELVGFRDWVKDKFMESVSDVSTWVQIAKNPESVPKLPKRN